MDTPPDKMDPQVAAHYQRGIDALDRRDFAEAEQAFQMCLQMDANAHDARMQLARTYIRQLKFASAEVELQMLIGLLKQAPAAQDKLSRAYLTLAQVLVTNNGFLILRLPLGVHWKSTLTIPMHAFGSVIF